MGCNVVGCHVMSDCAHPCRVHRGIGVFAASSSQLCPQHTMLFHVPLIHTPGGFRSTFSIDQHVHARCFSPQLAPRSTANTPRSCTTRCSTDTASTDSTTAEQSPPAARREDVLRACSTVCALLVAAGAGLHIGGAVAGVGQADLQQRACVEKPHWLCRLSSTIRSATGVERTRPCSSGGDECSRDSSTHRPPCHVARLSGCNRPLADAGTCMQPRSRASLLSPIRR